MLADFQQALADMTASPQLCIAARTNPAILSSRYALTQRELARLLAIVRHPGMSSACTVYRMNRLAPLAMNLRATLRALGSALRPLMSDYWHDHPRGHAHFFLEADRFCSWLRVRIEAGETVSSEAAAQLEVEAAAVGSAIAASCRPQPVGDAR